MNNEKLETLLERLLEQGYKVELQRIYNDFKTYAVKDKGFYVFTIYKDEHKTYYRLCDCLTSYIERYTEDFTKLLRLVNYYL